MIAFQTLVMTFKVLQSSKPSYLAKRIKYNTNQNNLRSSAQMLSRHNCRLSQSKEGFVYRGITLFNRLNLDTKVARNIKVFKTEARKWVLENISVKA